MARPFFEESILECARMGSDYSESYAVTETQTASGDSYAHLAHPYPVFRMTMDFANTDRAKYREDITSLYHKCQGSLAGFRARHHQDYSTNNFVDVPTATDQYCLPTDVAGQYQIVRWYHTQGDRSKSHRRIRKPVAGTVLVSIDGQPVTAGVAVSNTTGVITFTDVSRTITGISQAAQAVVTISGTNPYQVGDWVYISGVVGMTEINGSRYLVTSRTSSTITLAVNSTGFTEYTSGGNTHTAPQGSEIVRAGCYFDIPVHFIEDLNGNYSNANVVSGSFMVEELLNP